MKSFAFKHRSGKTNLTYDRWHAILDHRWIEPEEKSVPLWGKLTDDDELVPVRPEMIGPAHLCSPRNGTYFAVGIQGDWAEGLGLLNGDWLVMTEEDLGTDLVLARETRDGKAITLYRRAGNYLECRHPRQDGEEANVVATAAVLYRQLWEELD